MVRLFVALMGLSALLMSASASAAPPPVEDYGKLPAIELVRLSPSGARYAFVGDDGKARHVYVAATDNTPIQIVDFGGLKVHDIAWAGENFVLVRTTATADLGIQFTRSRMELSAVTVVNLKTHRVMTVFNSSFANVEHAVMGDYGTAQVNGRWYGYFGGLTVTDTVQGQSDYAHVSENGTIIRDLYRVDLETGTAEIAAKGQEGIDDWLVGPDGQVVARSLYDERSGAWSVWSGSFGGRELASGHEKYGDVDMLGLGRDGSSLLIRSSGDDGEIIEDYPLDGRPAKILADRGADQQVMEDLSTGRLIGMISDGDEPVYTLYSPELDAKVRGARHAFPGLRVFLTSWSTDFNHLIVFTDGGDDSGTYWIVDITKGSADPLGGAYPTVTPADVGPVRMVDWTAADGLALHGVLTLPPGREAKNLPVVVMPHGGPEARDYAGFDYWAQAYASLGYAVFQPNFRGSSGYGVKFRDAGFGEWGRKMQTDISDGLAQLGRQGLVDPGRACIVGASYGGYAALAGVTVQHGLYRCAVSVAGVSDLNGMLEYARELTGEENSSTRYWKSFMGLNSTWIGLDAISPVKLAGRADAPILLIHGKDDTIVPIEQSDAMARALAAASRPVERLTLDHGDHWLSREDVRVATLKASTAFVLKYNPPDPPPTAVATNR